MNTLVLFYTLGGTTEKVAEKIAAEADASLAEIKDTKKRSTFWAYTVGCMKAMSQKNVPISPLTVNLRDYSRFIICVPVWAGLPAPQFNSVIEKLPSGVSLEVVLCSASGDSKKSRPKLERFIRAKGIALASCRDVCTAKK